MFKQLTIFAAILALELNAAEIIHIGQAVMNSGRNTIKYFVETTFNYPTMAEAYRVATLNGMNRLF